MTLQVTGTVEATRNPKYQKVVLGDGSIYSVGLKGQPELVGKTVTVTVSVDE